MGKIYELGGENQTLSTGSVLIAFQTAASLAAAGRVTCKRLEISQNGSTTLQQIRGEFATRDTAGTLTTTSKTPQSVRPAGGAASGLSGNTSVIGGTARSGIVSSADSGGTYTSLFPFNFPNLAGYLWKPSPDEEIVIPSSTVMVVRLLAAPSTLTGWTFVLTIEEE